MGVTLSFRGLSPSPSLESQIRVALRDLEALFDRISACCVSVETPHRQFRQHRRGGLYRVAVELELPDRTIVGRSFDRTVGDANARIAVREAFRAAHSELDAYVQGLRRVCSGNS